MVHTTRAADVFAKMDKLGAEGKCFLFGVDFELDEGFLIEEPMEQSKVLFSINGVTNCNEQPGTCHIPFLRIVNSDRIGYDKGFDVVRRGLERGDTFLANLTARTEIELDLSLKEVFLRSAAPYRIYFSNRFVCFSPECFVKIYGDSIYTYPMKGTIDATLDEAESVLLNDYKETCEHYTIVDLMRNDLSSVSQNVHVNKFRYVDHIKTLRGEILQTSSEICGDLSSGWNSHIGDIVRKLLPAGSISGAPKPSTLNLIREAEKRKRGYYTGVFGFFDGKNFDSAVMIRFIEKDGDSFFFHSGGGITINSCCEDEYNEVIEKIYLSVK